MTALSAEDVADARAAMEATYGRPDYAGVAVADGYGVKVTVRKGALVLEDGIGPYRRTRTYTRATRELRRLVLANPDGFVTFEALRWCRGLGIAVVVLGPEGAPALQSAPRSADDARLRRAQALAPSQPVGLGIARYLLGAKLRGQGALVRERFGELSAADEVAGLAEAVEVAGTAEECRLVEAEAASTYFATWAGRPECVPHFPAKDRHRVPAHWLGYYGRRSSLLKVQGNRAATCPTNSLLNYSFALLEAEATLACYAVGLDPGLAVVHADRPGRASMALDLMEPVRPRVEGFVLDLLSERPLRKAELVEAPDGQVRLRPPLTHELAEAMPKMARWLAPHAEKVAHMLGDAMEGKYVPATPLTGDHRREAQARLRARKRPEGHRGGRPLDPGSERAVAARLGVGRYRARRARQLKVPLATLVDGGKLRHKNGDPGAFEPLRGALVGAGLSQGVIAKRCGVSVSAAGNWLAGRCTPRVRHWPALAELAGIELVDVTSTLAREGGPSS